MEDVGGVDVLEATEDLIQEVADVVVAQLLSFQQFVHIGLHQALHYVAERSSKGSNSGRFKTCIRKEKQLWSL